MTPHLSAAWSRRDILALALLRGVQGVDIRSAVEERPSLETVFTDPPPHLQRILRQDELFSARDIDALRTRADQMLTQLAAIDARAVTFWDDDYPALLRQIAYPPVVLYVHGMLQASSSLAIAVVGTRRCTTYGRLCAERFAAELAQSGCVIVSGLANGIDSIAHAATLDAGGITYAVIGSGLDRISPNHSRRLADRIIAGGGAVLSEYPLGTVARPGYFPQRNRIISGIARAVLVVESRREGGSLITAHFALDQSRDLFAVPGNITAPTSEGTNELIARQKAMAAISPAQVLAELGIVRQEPAEQKPPDFASPLEAQIWQELSGEPQSADDIAAALDLPVSEVLSALFMMEFRGAVRQLAGKQFIRVH
ncbi:MAG: DNA-processing protein DprA [Chlorobi bacterium]|nr:DNA-processing protein DprA [Chlorobiota bacterium]